MSNCFTCNGEGRIMLCVDDMCRGVRECMYERGDNPTPVKCFQTCRSCDGEGSVEYIDNGEYGE